MPLTSCNPPHPGKVLKELCLGPHGLSHAQAARALKMSHRNLMALLRGKRGVHAALAQRIAAVFGPNAECWLVQQQQYDRWRAQRDTKHVRHAKRGV
jgi:addiction module HigA family antidote